MATLEQMRQNLNATTCAVQHPRPAAGTPYRVPGGFEIDKAFADMAGANCTQRKNTTHDFFGNRAGATTQFEALRQAALNPDYTGKDPATGKDLPFKLEQVEQLRNLLRSPNNGGLQARALVSSMVSNAAMQANPTGVHPSPADSEALKQLIENNGVVPPTAPPAVPASPPAATPRAAPPAAVPPAR